MKLPLAGGIAGALALQAALLLTGFAQPLLVLSGALSLILTGLACWLAVRRAAGAAAAERVKWALVAAVGLLWLPATVLYLRDAVTGAASLPPRPADLLGAASATVMLGLIISSGASLSWRDHLRVGLDGVMVALALFVMAWPYLLLPTDTAHGTVFVVFAVVVTGMQIATVATALVLLSRNRPGTVNALTMLVAAAGSFAVMTFGAFTLVYDNGPTQQMTAIAGPMLIAELMLIAACRWPMPAGAPPWTGASPGVRGALAYVPVLGACAVAIVAWSQGRADLLLVVSWFALLATVLLRELLVVHSLKELLAEVRRQTGPHRSTGH